jgi:hypothetical protein
MTIRESDRVNEDEFNLLKEVIEWIDLLDMMKSKSNTLD